jgi:hypothetical protein
MRGGEVGQGWSSLQDIPGHERSLLALEAARWKGNLPAASVAEALVPSKVFAPSELLHGAGNPMGEVGTAKAGYVDTLGGAKPRTEKDKAIVEGARTYRQRQVGIIFNRLRETISSEEKRKEVLAGPSGAQLAALASAFKNWLDAKMPKQDLDNPGAAFELVSALFIFLKSFYR